MNNTDGETVKCDVSAPSSLSADEAYQLVCETFKDPAMRCGCGGKLTELDFPITKPKAKAKWFSLNIREAGRSPYRGTYRFKGHCCATGCQRITGRIYDPKGAIFLTY